MTSNKTPTFSIPGVVYLDLNLEENDLQEGALQVLKTIRPQWKCDDIAFKVFTVGITNKLIGCYLRDDRGMNDCVLVRIYGKKTEMIVDRDLELITIYVLHMAECSAPLYAKFNNGIAYGFIPGTCLDPETVRHPDIGKLVAEEMVKVSAVDPSKYSNGLSADSLSVLNQLNNREACLFKYINKFLTICPESFSDPEKNKRFQSVIPPLSELKKEALQLEKELADLGSPVVFCHNDLLLNNIVYNKDKGRCYFIDYEYAGFNYQAYDIANHFCEWAGVDELDYNRYPDKPTQLRWLRHYLKSYKTQQGHSSNTPTDHELEVLYVQVNKFSLASNFKWGVWALVQSKHSTIDFDFLEYSKLRLDQYYKTKQQFLALSLPQ